MSCAPPPEPRVAAPFEDRLFVACGLAWGAGLLYAVAALHHVDDRATAAIAALLLSAALLAWTVVVYRTPSRGARFAGATLALGALALWVVADPAAAASGPLGPFAGAPLLCKLLPASVPLAAGSFTPATLGTVVSIANIDVLALVGLVAVSRFGGRLAAALGGGLVLLSCVSLAIAAQAS
jgi:hypothetical protein